MKKNGGYTLIELMVAIGLFAFVMMLSSGAYLIIISVNRQTQALAGGVDDLSFALESMTRTIRTGTNFDCSGIGDCPNGANSFSVENTSAQTITYALSTQTGASGTVGDITVNGVPLTSTSVNITSLKFIASGTSKTDSFTPYVTIEVSGTVGAGAGKNVNFTVETSAAMRGIDI